MQCWIFILFIGCMTCQVYAQGDIDISSLQRPDLIGSQTIKGLLTISPKETPNQLLTRTKDGLRIEEASTTFPQSQYWWLVQDYFYKAFALVSVSDGKDWLYLEPNKEGGFDVVMTTNDKEENDYLDDNYFFQFVMLDTQNQEDKEYLVEGIVAKDQYLKRTNITNTINTTITHESLVINDTIKPEDFIFVFNTLSSFEDKYIEIPTYDSQYHTIESIANQTTGGSYTKITANSALAENDNTAIVGSGNITVLKKGGASDLFQLTFEEGTIARVGLLDYNISKFTKEALQTSGSRKLFSGIEMNEDGEIYIFNKGTEKYTALVANSPIILGYDNGTIVATQGDKSYTLGGVPTPILLNGDSGKYSRLLSIVRQGSIQLGYKPLAIVIDGKEFGDLDVPEQHTTDPQFSYAPSTGYTNAFDWRQKIYPIAFNNQGTIDYIFPVSPFYTTDDFDLAPIASKQSASGTYLGGEDFSSIDGWELVQMDFGYDYAGDPKENPRGEPYMVMYNRFTGTLRVFLSVPVNLLYITM